MTQTVRKQFQDPAPSPPGRQPALVATLRLAALGCRAAPRASVTACALLDPEAPAEEFARALALCLPQMLTRRPVLRRPGAARRSFDEDWLVALQAALSSGDRSSARFLLRRRVRPEAVPYLTLLLNGLSERLYD